MAIYHWWLIAGIILTVAEIVVPGFVIICFGLAALAVGALSYLLPEMSLAVQMSVFSGLSILMLVLFRVIFVSRTAKAGGLDEVLDGIVGSEAAVIDAIRPGVPGRVSFRGATWQARAEKPIGLGEVVRIVAQENITLVVESVDL